MFFVGSADRDFVISSKTRGMLSCYICNGLVSNLHTESTHKIVAKPSRVPKTPISVKSKILNLNFESKRETRRAKLKGYTHPPPLSLIWHIDHVLLKLNWWRQLHDKILKHEILTLTYRELNFFTRKSAKRHSSPTHGQTSVNQFSTFQWHRYIINQSPASTNSTRIMDYRYNTARWIPGKIFSPTW